MSAQVVQLQRAAERLLTKKQLAIEISRSERWIELRQHDGLPVADTDRYGRRRYRLDDVQAWLHENSQRPRTASERIAALEAEVRELRAMIESQAR